MEKEMNITVCPICKEQFSESRVLPCIHTFCLKCIQDYGKKTQPGMKLECPVCRENFTIPEEGLSMLPGNYFINKTIELQKLTVLHGSNGLCDVGLCASTDRGTDEPKDRGADEPKDRGADEPNSSAAATMYCFDCHEQMCDHCAMIHHKYKMSKSHEVEPIEMASKKLDSFLAKLEMMCERHPMQERELYCSECKIAVCVTCFKADHQKHPCSDILQIGNAMKKQIQGDVRKINKLLLTLNEQLEKLAASLKEFTESIDRTKSEILERGEETKKFVDMHVQSMLNELEEEQVERMTYFESMKDELEIRRRAFTSFKGYAQEVIRKASPVYVTQITKDLNIRADQMMNQPSLDLEEPVQASLVTSDLQMFTKDNIIGKLSFESIECSQSGNSNEEESFVLFPNESLPACHTYKAGFEINGTTYNSVEQYLLHRKALHDEKREIAEAVMLVDDPDQLNVFRSILKLTPEWEEVFQRNSVRRAYIEQFKKNSGLKRKLFSTIGATLAFASKTDLVLGIGLKDNDYRARRRKNWRGRNVLGEILTEVREELLRQKRASKKPPSEQKHSTRTIFLIAIIFIYAILLCYLYLVIKL